MNLLGWAIKGINLPELHILSSPYIPAKTSEHNGQDQEWWSHNMTQISSHTFLRLVVICSDTKILIVKNYELHNILFCVGGNVVSEFWWQGPDTGHPNRCILNPSITMGGKGMGIIKTPPCNLEGMVRNVVNVQLKYKYCFVQGRPGPAHFELWCGGWGSWPCWVWHQP